MPLAVTHVLVPIILLEFFRDRIPKVRKFFSRKYVFLAGIAGLLPDMDLPMCMLLAAMGQTTPATDVGHRVFLHNIWIPLGFLAFFLLFYYVLPRATRPKRLNLESKQGRQKKQSMHSFETFGKIFLILFFAWSIHLALDAILTGHVMPFYPLNDYTLNYNLVQKVESATGISMLTIEVSMDALLLLLWLWHEEFTHKIVDYF